MTAFAARKLAEYLRKRLEYLQQCNAELEEKIACESRDLCRGVESGRYQRTDPIVGRIIFHLEFVVANTFRYTLLVAVCSFLEEAVKEVTRAAVPDYAKQMQSERRGSWLAKHLRILRNAAKFDDAAERASVEKFRDLIALRNCVVHAWGKVPNSRNPTAVHAAAKRIDTAEVTKDGCLKFGDQVVPDAIIASEAIADSILTQLFGVSIT